MMKNAQRKGVSLMVLIITIVVIIILVSVVVINVDDSREVAKEAVFINELITVQDSVKEYYIMNGELPIYGEQLDKTKFVSKVEMDNEIAANADTNATFYKVDVSKLALENLTLGLNYASTSSDDYFAMTYPGFRIYYIQGVKIDGIRYHSLTQELTGKVDTTVNEEIDTSTTSITSYSSNGRIKVIKNNSLTNEVSANIVAQMKSDENLKLEVDTQIIDITTKTGENVIVLENVVSVDVLNKIKETKKIALKIIDSSSKEVERVEVDFEVSSEAPVFGEDDEITSYDTQHTLTFSVTSDVGIAYVKYDYDTMYSFNNVTEKYYSNMTSEQFDTHVYTNGKNATINTSDLCTISAPNNVKNIRIVAVDKAGNATYATKEISKGIYSYPTLNNVFGKSVDINCNVISTIGIKNVTISYSLDNSTYLGATTYTLDSTGNTASVKVTYDNILASLLYIKTQVVSADGTITETNVTKLNITNDLDVLDAGVIKSNPDAYYGKTVTGYTSETQVNEWQIFHSDGTNIYLIAKEYLEISQIPNMPNGTAPGNISPDYPRGMSLENTTTYYTGSADITTANPIYNKLSYVASYPTSENANMKAVAYMVDQTVWDTFKGNNAKYAIGGPTLEQFADSYNSVSHDSSKTTLYVKVQDEYGYDLSLDNVTFVEVIKNLNDSNYHALYSKRTSLGATSWHIGSPGTNVNSVYHSNLVGDLGTNYITAGYYGFRPLVCLNSNVQLQEQADGSYKIK